jgi:tetratricopeptide (TPR) repeat protein
MLGRLSDYYDKNGGGADMAVRNSAAGRTQLFAAYVFASMASPAIVMSANNAANCETEFVHLMQDASRYPDLASRTKRLEQMGPQCKGTGIYEARLAHFYTEEGRYDEARDMVAQGLKAGSHADKELRLAQTTIEFRQGRLADAERHAVKLIEDFPNWNGGYLSLGETRLVQHRFQEGIEQLEHANALEPVAGAYTLLTMAYYQVGRPRDSAKAMQAALRLDIVSLKHTQAVCAAAYSLVSLGHVPEADDLLVKHARARPDAVNDSTYKAALHRVREARQVPLNQ